MIGLFTHVRTDQNVEFSIGTLIFFKKHFNLNMLYQPTPSYKVQCMYT